MAEALVPDVVMAPPTLGAITGLPLAKFAMAELIARAHRAGFLTLWDYIEQLEHEAGRTIDNFTDPLLCADPTHHELLVYARHLDDCTKPITYVCSCGFDQIEQ